MSADDDMRFVSAPAPTVPDESKTPTMMIDRGSSGFSKTMLVIGGLILVLIASVVLAFHKLSPDGAAAATAATVTVDEEASGDGAAAAKADAPAECAGEIADPQLRWYCTEFLPFAKKAAADHDRIDRLEAEGKGSGAPLGLWLIVIATGILTVVNTLMILSKRTKPPAG